MKKIVTYLSERDYIENRYKPIDLEQYKYWMGANSGSSDHAFR